MNEYQFKSIMQYSWSHSQQRSAEYLAKYWLADDEYTQKYASVRQMLFLEKPFVSERTSIHYRYEVFRTLGGVLFTEQEFSTLQSLAYSIGDETIVIEEDAVESDPHQTTKPSLRMRYPRTTTWAEVYPHEEGLSYELFGVAARNYCVYSDSGLWGKYSANDWKNPQEYWIFAPQVRIQFLSFLMTLPS